MKRSRYESIMAVFPNTRGFAYVVFEGPLSPVDWGISDVRGTERNGQCLRRLSVLLDRHMPSVLVLRSEGSASSLSQTARTSRLIKALEGLAEARNLFVVKISRKQIGRSFEFLGSPTRYAIVETIAKHIPLFARYVPPVRKIWKSEDRRMGLFDAAALALTFYRQNSAPNAWTDG